MNWAAVAAIAAIIGIITTVVGVAFASGKFVERFQAVELRADGHEAIQKEHAAMLGSHAMQIDRLEQWRNGYNAAANVSGGSVIQQTGH